tara:strand:- start:510 stop:818 length:309 start_codon:yes stop_codon:yes gene_type:complete
MKKRKDTNMDNVKEVHGPTVITFKNDDERSMFQIRMCLIMLRSEVQMGMPFTSKGNPLHVLKRHLARIAPDFKLSRVKKVALRQLQEAGAYDDLGENSNQAH